MTPIRFGNEADEAKNSANKVVRSYLSSPCGVLEMGLPKSRWKASCRGLDGSGVIES